MVEEDLHLIQGFMHQAGTRAVADLIRTQSGEVEVYQVPRRPEIQASPAAYPTTRVQHRTLPPWALVAVAALWVVAFIGLVVWVVRWFAAASATAVVGHSGAAIIVVGLTVLAAMMLVSRRQGSKTTCSGAHCGGCDR